MSPKTSQELASEYLALIRKNITNGKKVAEIASAWMAKQISKAHYTKDEDRHFLKEHGYKK